MMCSTHAAELKTSKLDVKDKWKAIAEKVPGRTDKVSLSFLWCRAHCHVLISERFALSRPCCGGGYTCVGPCMGMLDVNDKWKAIAEKVPGRTDKVCLSLLLTRTQHTHSLSISLSLSLSLSHTTHNTHSLALPLALSLSPSRSLSTSGRPSPRGCRAARTRSSSLTMYVCIYVYIYMCMYVCIYIYIYKTVAAKAGREGHRRAAALTRSSSLS